MAEIRETGLGASEPLSLVASLDRQRLVALSGGSLPGRVLPRSASGPCSGQVMELRIRASGRRTTAASPPSTRQIHASVGFLRMSYGVAISGAAPPAALSHVARTSCRGPGRLQ